MKSKFLWIGIVAALAAAGCGGSEVIPRGRRLGVAPAAGGTGARTGEDAKPHVERVFEKFETIVPGRLSEADYDAFVRDTVNFLDYASEPAQVKRRHLGVFVVLFLIAFTWLAMLLKKEYWKDVH